MIAEKKFKTNLVEIVTKFPLDMSIKIEPLPLALLDSVLVLEPPKKVIQYVPTAVSSSSAAINQDSKLKAQKPRVSRGPKVVRPKRAQTETASIYAEEEKSAGIVKRSRLTEDADDEYSAEVVFDDSYYNGRLGETVVSNVGMSRKRTPDNFEKVAGELFNEFWSLEFEDHEITWAFFAKITSLNCRDYNLPNFADTSYCLAVINVRCLPFVYYIDFVSQDKLKNNAYLSTEDFVFDFHQMFANILKYYDEAHPAYRKAIELSQMFETKWAVALTKFKW